MVIARQRLPVPNPGSGGMSAAVVAEFVSQVRWDSMPAKVRGKALLVNLDTLGTLLAGRSTPAGRLAQEMVVKGVHLDVSTAARSARAFADAVAASALDLDDGHVEGGGIHASAVIVPTLLAISRGRDVGGGEFLASLVAGYEVAVRLGKLLYPRSRSDTYHCAGTAACVGAAAGAVRLVSGDAEVIRCAIEIATAHAPMATFQLPMIKESIGWSAATASFAVEMALSGFKQYEGDLPLRPGPSSFGVPTPFDEPRAAKDNFVRSLGREYAILDGYFKPYACCRYIHAAVDALLQIMTDQRLRPSQVQSVVVRTHEGAADLDESRPQTLDHAQYSIPFVLGVALARGSVGAGDMTMESLEDPEILRFTDCVCVEHATEFDSYLPLRYPAEVEVVMTDGSKFVERRLDARGDPSRPLSDREVRVKFLNTVANAIEGPVASSLLSVCQNLPGEQVQRLIDVMDLIETTS